MPRVMRQRAQNRVYQTGDSQKNGRKLSAIEATGLTFVFLSLTLSKSIIFILIKDIFYITTLHLSMNFYILSLFQTSVLKLALFPAKFQINAA
jgi:hypothetical protein